MLTPTDLRAALSDAVKQSGSCLKWCLVGIEPTENGLRVHHNGLGSHDSRDDVVYAKHVLEADATKLAALLAKWITAAHQGKGFDLNVVQP